MLELFVFNALQRTDYFPDASDLIIEPLKTNTSLGLADLATSFNLMDTQCYRYVDRQTIFGIVETAGDGSAGFTEAVRQLARGAGEKLGEHDGILRTASPARKLIRRLSSAGSGTILHTAGRKVLPMPDADGPDGPATAGAKGAEKRQPSEP